MELTAELDAACSPAELFSWVEDLDRYPAWLGIVTRAVRDDGDGSWDDAVRGAWIVDLEARLGPVARAKRLRMERTEHDPSGRVVFERRELDGRVHGRWVLRAEVTSPEGAQSHLAMRLHYDGRLWGPAVAAVLQREIEASSRRLLALVSPDSA